jgi:hypothetical protein
MDGIGHYTDDGAIPAGKRSTERLPVREEPVHEGIACGRRRLPRATEPRALRSPA